MEAFWTIVSYTVLLGIGALVSFVFYAWIVIVPDRVEAAKVPVRRS